MVLGFAVLSQCLDEGEITNNMIDNGVDPQDYYTKNGGHKGLNRDVIGISLNTIMVWILTTKYGYISSRYIMGAIIIGDSDHQLMMAFYSMVYTNS